MASAPPNFNLYLFPYSTTGSSGGNGSGIIAEPNANSKLPVGLTSPGFSIPLAAQTVASGGLHNILPMPTTGIVSGKAISTVVYSGGTFTVCVEFYWATNTPLTIANYGQNFQFISSVGGIITAATPFSVVNGFLNVATLGGGFTSIAGTAQQVTFLGIYNKVS